MSLVANTKGEWREAVKRLYGRKNLVNYDLALKMITSQGYDKFYTENTTIIDAYAGLGVLSAALHNTIKPKKHIILEPHRNYRTFLESLCTPKNTLQVFASDPFRWASFTSLVENGVYTPSKQPRTHIHNEILYTANLSTVQGEQLCTQYLNCIANQSWLQQYGRVRLLLCVRQSTAKKLFAQPASTARHRVSVQTESVADGLALIGAPLADKTDIASFQQPLYPAVPSDYQPTASTEDMPVIISLDPKEHQVPYLDSFEYVIKSIFILRTRPLSEALATLGPGAPEDLLPKLKDIADLKPRNMSLEQIMRVVEAFELWPFKPEILHDFYDDTTKSAE